jgi:GT2 family glycosyltransferase
MIDQSALQPDLSFCIVSLNAASYLRECLISLRDNTHKASYEVIVVDNGSTDDTLTMLEHEFPSVTRISNEENLGYTRPMNQALQAAKGRYLVQLNADTLVHPAAFDILLGFMQAHADVGICTPKVLNSDGSLQLQCRRSAARPWDVITYFTGLWKLFPRSPLFGRYLLTYRGEDEIHEADAVSGSCMFIRREVIENIGYLDETYFAFQEDTDFCVRAHKAGWKVYYVPLAQITHFGGKSGTGHQPFRSIYHWHRSYLIYYQKHLAGENFFLVNWLMYAGMVLKLGVSLAANLFRREKVVGTRKP